MILLEIPFATPSLNTVQRQHWLTAWRSKKKWVKLVRDALIVSGNFPPPPPPPFAVVRIERFGPRQLDHDNMLGGAKSCIDALKDLRLIEDDSPEHIQLHMVGLINKIPGTRVRITARVP